MCHIFPSCYTPDALLHFWLCLYARASIPFSLMLYSRPSITFSTLVIDEVIYYNVEILSFRHPQPALSYSYRYRFKVPDSLSYDISCNEFKNEKLENYNWNYFDQYICTHGEGDFGLLEVKTRLTHIIKVIKNFMKLTE